MARRLIVDTGVLVADERGRAALRQVVTDDDELLVAATAAATGRTVLTMDRRAQFHDLPGVDALVVG